MFALRISVSRISNAFGWRNTAFVSRASRESLTRDRDAGMTTKVVAIATSPTATFKR
jgi:hypothetical protein